MPNMDAANGFRWHRRGGGTGSAVLQRHKIGDATEVKFGDPVSLDSDGLVVRAATDADILGVAAHDHPPDGVIPGDWYKGEIDIYPADMDTLFHVQVSEDADFVHATHVGNAYGFKGDAGEVELDLTSDSAGDQAFYVLAIHPNSVEDESNARVLGYFVNTARGKAANSA